MIYGEKSCKSTIFKMKIMNVHVMTIVDMVVNIVEQGAMLISVKIIVKLYFYCPLSYHKLTGSCPDPVINFPSTPP